MELKGRRLYLAVDCGGSKAAAAISISSKTPGQGPTFLSRGFGGAANYTDVGLTRFLCSVRQAVEAALDEAGIDWRQSSRSSDKLDVASTSAHPLSSSPLSSYEPRLPAHSDEEGHSFTFPPVFHAAWLGIAGVDSHLNISVLSPHLSRLLAIPYPSPRLIVANDTSLLASPVMERDKDDSDDVKEGVVCIAGTGSIVMSFRSRRQTHKANSVSPSMAPTSPDSLRSNPENSGSLLEAVGRVGGFGWLLGDEAGGYMVGKRAVRAVLDQADRDRLGLEADEDECEGGDAKIDDRILQRRYLLRDRILAHWHLASTDDLLDTVYSNNDIIIPSNSSANGGHRTSVAASSVAPSESGRRSTSPGLPGSSSRRTSEDASQNFLPPASRLHPDSSRRANLPGDVSPIPPVDSYPSSPKPGEGAHRSSNGGLQPSTMTGGGRSSSTSPLFSTIPMEVDGFEEERRSRLEASTVSWTESNLAESTIHGSNGASSTAAHSVNDHNPSATTLGVGIRKLRLASLAPVVFHLAFAHDEPLSLGILRGEIRNLVTQIELLLQRAPEETQPSSTDGPVFNGHGHLQHNEAALMCGHSTDYTIRLSAAMRARKRTTKLDPRRVVASRSTLCLGGSLLGVAGYRSLLVEELGARGWHFQRVVHVEDVAKRGCEALGRGFEGILAES